MKASSIIAALSVLCLAFAAGCSQDSSIEGQDGQQEDLRQANSIQDSKGASDDEGNASEKKADDSGREDSAQIEPGSEQDSLSPGLNESPIAEDEKEDKQEPKKANETEEDTPDATKEDDKQKLVMFHNGKGPMCIEQLDFLDSMDICDSLVIEEHLTTQSGTYSILSEYKSGHDSSKGISLSFGYLPITFVNDHAYSGFNSDVGAMLRKDIEEVCR